MILQLYAPEDMYDPFRRCAVMWYSRYDVMAGLMAGNATVLSREWYTTIEDRYREDSANYPDDMSKKVGAWCARNRTTAMDMASFLAKVVHGLISPEDFAAQKEILAHAMQGLGRQLDSLKDSRYLVTSFPHRQPLGPEDIVDPYVPGLIYTEPLWEVNMCTVDYYGGMLMYKHQFALMTQSQDMFMELKDLAYAPCQILETMWRMPSCPKDSSLFALTVMGFIPLFLPADEAHQMWTRRRLAKIEQLG